MKFVFLFSSSGASRIVTLNGNDIQVTLETEYDNFAALALYESLGFIREKRLFRFYMNGKDAFRLVLRLTESELRQGDEARDEEDSHNVMIMKKGV